MKKKSNRLTHMSVPIEWKNLTKSISAMKGKSMSEFLREASKDEDFIKEYKKV